jgi:hypothetical protein
VYYNGRKSGEEFGLILLRKKKTTITTTYFLVVDTLSVHLSLYLDKMNSQTKKDNDQIILRLYSNGMVYGLFERIKENQKEEHHHHHYHPTVECLLSSSGMYFSIYPPNHSDGNGIYGEMDSENGHSCHYRNMLVSRIQHNGYDDDGDDDARKGDSDAGKMVVGWKQRTAFCWTPYRDYVIEMLRFRNMYYPKPYMAVGWLEPYYPILKVC